MGARVFFFSTTISGRAVGPSEPFILYVAETLSLGLVKHMNMSSEVFYRGVVGDSILLEY
jgi:hypothetical protein